MVSCPINKLDSGIHYLHSADETAVQWLKHISHGTYDNDNNCIISYWLDIFPANQLTVSKQ